MFFCLQCQYKKPGGRVTFPDDTAAGLHSNILFAQRLILAVIRQIIVVSLLNMSAGVIVPVHQKLEAVSYTHLDVYKRQAAVCLVNRIQKLLS